MVNPDINSNELNPIWRELLAGEDPRLRWGWQIFRLLSPTASERCRLCNAGLLRNPHFCENCEIALAREPGGAEVDIAMLYADVRGSTEMATRLGPTVTMQRLFSGWRRRLSSPAMPSWTTWWAMR